MLYNYLLAGLEELRLGQPQKMSQEELLAELRTQLTQKDMRLLDLLRMTKDSPLVQEMLDANPDLREESSLSEDDLKTQLYYQYGAKCGNRFVRDWFLFNLDLNNVLAATVCRRHGFDVQKAVVGNNEVAQQLRKNLSAKDFGLAGILPDYADIMKLADIDNPLEREKNIDALRWQWLEDHTVFCNFEIENVLAYWLQSVILHRWDTLTVEKGEKVFRELLAEMKKGIKLEI
ncbi:MAG: DUF2764 domain-containing protein [Paludibacter sp.]|nr:DUF2764 domain-containing protein [Bacteroidales bacterium]MCM1069012.1 DUF2764 domain-containing protein [Prevotella sp.]MCM1353675.1 DUF2764 domain-containing protein [Bacteroides sp.]MCM1441976.1 DUF2764 domain-containing protein [Muribaculum sp.]MCM1481568.1 DUF2764 domain-containing protein [Paludibacter sp.]